MKVELSEEEIRLLLNALYAWESEYYVEESRLEAAHKVEAKLKAALPNGH